MNAVYPTLTTRLGSLSLVFLIGLLLAGTDCFLSKLSPARPARPHSAMARASLDSLYRQPLYKSQTKWNDPAFNLDTTIHKPPSRHLSALYKDKVLRTLKRIPRGQDSKGGFLPSAAKHKLSQIFLSNKDRPLRKVISMFQEVGGQVSKPYGSNQDLSQESRLHSNKKGFATHFLDTGSIQGHHQLERPNEILTNHIAGQDRSMNKYVNHPIENTDTHRTVPMTNSTTHWPVIGQTNKMVPAPLMSRRSNMATFSGRDDNQVRKKRFAGLEALPACPSHTDWYMRTTGFDTNNTVVRIVQVPGREQWFQESECEVRHSPSSEGVCPTCCFGINSRRYDSECRNSYLYVSAVVKDFNHPRPNTTEDSYTTWIRVSVGCVCYFAPV